ncbi:MAG: MATE family efflux transporter [Roseburia sp.]|nr:MATE family efflux transporter [Roseburia sp.]
MKRETFAVTVLKIALPVTLQSLLQFSFSVVDQVMIGKLGSYSIAGIGLGGKFVSIYSVVLAAIASAAGIMISQYMGGKDETNLSRSFSVNMALSMGLAIVFAILSLLFPEQIMTAYTKDEVTRALAVDYIRILAVSFLPMAVSSIVTTMLRCMEKAALPLYAGILALILNTGLNYVFIFGKWMFPAMGVEGAALATVIAQTISCVLVLVFCRNAGRKRNLTMNWKKSVSLLSLPQDYRRQYLGILCPILICEFMWSMGENVYAMIYGNMGTDACAAMTMTIPVQTLMIGALSGLSQAVGILTGKSLGAGQYEKAYRESKKIMFYGMACSLFLSAVLLIAGSFYVRIYNVENYLQEMTKGILVSFAIISPVKILNMILGGGIIRSGGKTKYVMWIDMAGTWLFGVPVGFLAAFVWKLPIFYVYFLLSLEECVRFGISLVIFVRKTWMGSLFSGIG